MKDQSRQIWFRWVR